MLDKRLILISILFVMILVIPSGSASDNLTDDTVSVSDEDVIEVDSDSENLSAGSKSFLDLNSLINDNDYFDVYLNNDYTYNPSTDSAFKDGVVISRSISLHGNGYTLNGNNQARIFTVNEYSSFYDVTFINAKSDKGSAILGDSFTTVNCQFTSNYATTQGGALNGGYAQNCVFKYNTAGYYGGAMYTGSVDNCTFIANSANEGGALYNVYSVNSQFSQNSANKYGGAMYGSSAGQCSFSENTATLYGGAMYNAYAVECSFIKNSAERGGAFGGERSVENSVFDQNSADYGGAIYGGSAIKCTFTNNKAKQGGAMYTGSASDSVFTTNTADVYGGALMEVYALRCNFTSNYAPKGGAMYQNSALHCNFISNTAENGGAMFNAYASDCTFKENSAQKGGAIDEGSAESSIFRQNHAANGGAISSSSSRFSTFYDNYADEYGGALYDSSAVRCYFRGNKAKFGGAISSGSSASESTFLNNSATVSGGARYDSYVVDCTFEGNTPEYVLYVSDFTAVEGFGGDFDIKLADSPDYEVKDVNTTIVVKNSKNKVVGTYTCPTGYSWFVDLSAGKYKATVTVDDVSFELDSVKVNIVIKKSTSIYAADVNADYNSGKVLLVNLHDSSGTVLKYAAVSVTLSGITKSYFTDDNGQAIVTTDGLNPGSYVANINYDGDGTYVGFSTSAKVTINKVSPKITASNAKFKKKLKTKAYKVTLKDNKNKVMKKVTLTLTINGKTYTAKTSKKGIATFKIKKLTKKGKYKTVISYAGSSIYNAVSKTVKITVK